MGQKFAEEYRIVALKQGVEHWRAAFDAKFMRHFDLGGKPQIVTITDAKQSVAVFKDGTTESKMLITLGEFPKPWRTNVTNCELIEQLYGPDPGTWIGKRIELYPTKTRFGGQVVDCMRVRDRIPEEPARRQQSAPAKPKAELPERMRAFVADMAASSSDEGLAAIQERIVNEDTLTNEETEYLTRQLARRKAQLEKAATQ